MSLLRISRRIEFEGNGGSTILSVSTMTDEIEEHGFDLGFCDGLQPKNGADVPIPEPSLYPDHILLPEDREAFMDGYYEGFDQALNIRHARGYGSGILRKLSLSLAHR